MLEKSLTDKSNQLNVQFHKLNESEYQDVWDFQTLLHNKIKLNKTGPYSNFKQKPLNHLVFCEHRPVYTLGKSAKPSHLLSDEKTLSQEGFELFPVNRGGDITYHGPGQLTGYLILDLELLYRDVHRFVRTIEEAIISLLKEYGLEGHRIPDFTGVWIIKGKQKLKVCAIGVHLSRWVSMHGFALNINTELSHFNNIIPCGIAEKDKTVTSLSQLLGKRVEQSEVENRLKIILAEKFNLKILNI